MTTYSRAIAPTSPGRAQLVTYIDAGPYESPLYADTEEFGRVHIHRSCVMAGYRLALQGVVSVDGLLDDCFAGLNAFGGWWPR